MSDFNPRPRVMLRFVDNLFCVFNCEAKLELFFAKINTVHCNTQFTKELEQHNQLPYLDVLVTKSDGKFEISVFRKKTNTDLEIKWSSLCPLKYKRNLILCLLDCAYHICISYKSMHIEFNNITDMLLRNGYPLIFIQNQIRQFLNSKYSESDSHRKNDRCIPRIILKLSFIGDPSLHLEKELKLFFSSLFVRKIKFKSRA